MPHSHCLAGPVVEPAEAQDYPSDVDEDDDLMTEEETVKSGPETSAVCQSAVPFLGGAVDDREGGNRDNVNVEQLQRTDEGSDGGDTSVAETTPDGDDGRAVANRLSEPSVLSAHEPDVSVEHAVYQSIQDPTTRFEPTDDYVGDINAVTPDHDKRTSPDASQHDDGNVIETPSDSNDVGSASADNSGEVGNLAISSAGMQLKRETIGAFDEAMEHKADNSASIRTDEHVLSKAEEEGYPESFNGPRDHDAMSPGVDTERGARDDDDGMARINADVNSEGGEISDVIHGARDADSRSLKAGNPIESCGNIEMDVHERSGKKSFHFFFIYSCCLRIVLYLEILCIIQRSISKDFVCSERDGNIGKEVEQEEKLYDGVEAMRQFAYLGDMVSVVGGCEDAVAVETRCGWISFMDVAGCCMERGFLYSEAWCLREIEMKILRRTQSAP